MPAVSGAAWGASTMDTGPGGFSMDSIWVVSVWVSGIIVVWASGPEAGVAEPEVTGIGGMPVTCVLLVLHLLLVRMLKTLEIKPWLFFTCNSLTCSSRN